MGYYVMKWGGGRYTSVGYYGTKEEAEREVTRILQVGGWSGRPPVVEADAGSRTIHQAQVALRSIGISLTYKDGEYRVNFKNGPERTAYYTDDLNDALETGRAMSREGLQPPMRNPTYKKYGGRQGSSEFRPMTLEEGKMLGYGDHIWFIANDGSARQVKVNGAVKRWKREPDRIEVPVKYGMYEYATFYTRDFGPDGRVLMPV